MKIKKLVLMAIRGNPSLRSRIKDALDVSEPTLRRLLAENNDDLTKAAVLKLIREDLEIKDEEILELEVEDGDKATTAKPPVQ